MTFIYNDREPHDGMSFCCGINPIATGRDKKGTPIRFDKREN